MPLRPELFERLNGVPKLGRVLIANEGQSMVATVKRDKGRFRLRPSIPGEEYRVNCPFCDDTRHRLYVNHMWGRRHPITKSKNLWLAHCFNEECLNDYDNRIKLYDLVFGDPTSSCDDRVLPGKAGLVEFSVAETPGEVTPIQQLPSNHPAIAYLRSRGFDPDQLGQHLDIGYCTRAEPRFRLASERIIIPIFMEKKLVGWQARHVGKADRYVPKYWTGPGTPKKSILYNFDNAKSFPVVILCEGCLDVWRVGPQAVALLGKTLSYEQELRIVSQWSNGSVIVLLDGDTSYESQAIYDRLSGKVERRIVVQLPLGTDPADCDRPTLEQYIARAAKQYGVDLKGLR